MAPLTPEELQADIRQSDLLAEYGTGGGSGERAGDAGCAHGAHPGHRRPRRRLPMPAAAGTTRADRRAARTVAQVAGGALVGALSSTIGRTVGREIIRGIFGLLGAKPPRSTTTRRSRW